MDSEVRSALKTIYLPPLNVVVEGASNTNPTPEHEAIYKEWCDNTIKMELQAIDRRNKEVAESWDEAIDLRPLPEIYNRPMVRTHYPIDDFESEDVVGLDKDGNLVVLDEGSR